jgi:hypothetical protein
MRISIRCLIVLGLTSGFISAQNKSLLYDFTEIPQALMVNPGARASYSWYAGVPILSGISVQAGSSGLVVGDIFADDGLDINEKVRLRAVNGMSVRDDISNTTQVEILSGGFRDNNRPDTFYSFGLYQETDIINYWPRDLAILAWEGNANQLGRRFSLSHLKVRGEGLNVFHFGLNKKLNSRWTVGGRAKLYSGIFNVQSTQNSGYFLTTEGENNILSNTLVADMRVRTSGIEALSDSGGVNEIVRRGFLGGDLGLGIDLGFTHSLSEQLLLTGSLLDLGFMVHYTDVTTYTLNGSATVEGVEVIFPDALANPDSDFWQALVDEIEALIPFEENQKTYLSFRPTKLYGSIRYNFGEPAARSGGEACDCDYNANSGPEIDGYRNGVGGQLFVVNRPRGPQMALTAFYLRRIGNVMALKATYTVDKYSFSNLGLGLNLQAGPVEFYLLADNLLGYQNLANSPYASLQFGLNILSWGRN